MGKTKTHNKHGRKGVKNHRAPEGQPRNAKEYVLRDDEKTRFFNSGIQSARLEERQFLTDLLTYRTAKAMHAAINQRLTGNA